VIPGTKKSSPILPSSTTFPRLCSRLLPGRSGNSSRRSPSTATKPGASPRGDASGQPSSRAVETTTKGERSMNARAWTSMRSMSFLAASAVGGP
jgi:hypothetical protein